LKKYFWVVWTNKDDRLILKTSTDLSKYYKDYLTFFLGGLSIAVPGEVRGLYDAWTKYGWLQWKQLVQPAIDLARNGFEITEAVEDALKTTKGIEQDIRDDPGLRLLHSWTYISEGFCRKYSC